MKKYELEYGGKFLKDLKLQRISRMSYQSRLVTHLQKERGNKSCIAL